MDPDLFNCPQSLHLAASRPGLRHLCNRKYCPPITPSAPVTQSPAISISGPIYFLGLEGCLTKYPWLITRLWSVVGFLSVCYYPELQPGMILHTCLLLSLTPTTTTTTHAPKHGCKAAESHLLSTMVPPASEDRGQYTETLHGNPSSAMLSLAQKYLFPKGTGACLRTSGKKLTSRA